MTAKVEEIIRISKAKPCQTRFFFKSPILINSGKNAVGMAFQK